MDANIEKQFRLNQQLKAICRIALMTLFEEREPDPPTAILMTFYEKAIDLVDGMILLHQSNLVECSEALIRILFETYLKYKHYVSILMEDEIAAATLVMDSMMIMAERNALEQDKIFGETISSGLGDLSEIKAKYHKKTIAEIKQHGFPGMSVRALAEKYGKEHEYIMMYRSFSRNVHANDTKEYYLKHQPCRDLYGYINVRDAAAFDLTFRLFFEMMFEMNELIPTKIDSHLKAIANEFKSLDDNDVV